MILLSLASKQIWPHVLTAAHLKPARLFLLHTEDTSESSDPARRLKRFFDNGDLVPKGNTRLERIPHDDFTAIERALDDLQTSQKLSLSECCLNFTGGNKLMATAAFRWATRRGLSSCTSSGATGSPGSALGTAMFTPPPSPSTATWPTTWTPSPS